MKYNHKEKILLRASNLWYFGEGMLGPLLAVFTEHIGGNILDISWAWAIYLLVTGVLVIIIGRYSDGARRKEKLLVLGYALHSILTFAYLLVKTPTQLFFLQAGFGIALALSWPTWDALYAKYQPKKSAGYIWGLADGEAYLLTGIAVLIGGAIITYASFTALFIIMGIIQIVATIYQARILTA